MNSEQTQNISGKRSRGASLQTRLVLFVLLLVLTPLIIISIRDTLQTQQALTYAAEAALKSSAEQTASRMDTFIQTGLDSITAEAQFSEFTTYLSLTTGDRQLVQGRAQDQLNILKSKSEFIVSCALVDTNGIVLLDTMGANANNDESGEPYFLQVRDSNKTVVTAVTYSKDKTPIITFAGRIVNLNGKYVGSLRVVYKSAILQDVLTKSADPAVTDASILLLDDLHIRMADSRNPELNLKSVAPLAQPDYYTAVTTHRFLNIPREQQATNYSDFELALANASKQPFFRADITPGTTGDDTIAVAFLKTIPWMVAYGRPTSNFLADIQGQTRINIILIFAASILITIIATVSVRNLTNPIISLTRTANAISKGILSARADVNSTDEIGVLASTFNNMSSQIQDLVTGLEQRVEQRTSELEQRTIELEHITQESEKRADELQTITEIARYISTEKELENLLPLITQTVSQRFGYYHIGIFLLDDQRKFAVLRAANSPGGQVMLNRQHKLEVGQVGIVGNVTSTGTPRIALDTGTDAVFFNNPDLPDTRSEMALPLTARGTIIGALDVQSVMPNAFTERDVSILSLLADQLAIAIDSVRLLAEAQNALNESQSLFHSYLADAWQKKSTSEVLGYYQTITGGKLITGKTNKAVDLPTDVEKDTLAMPIRLRDQVIGTLNIRPNSDGRTWSKEEVSIVQAVTERLGLALDNARLFEETSTRAARERTVSEITTKIRSTNNPQEIIDTAIQELQHALGVSRVEIVPQKTAPSPDK